MVSPAHAMQLWPAMNRFALLALALAVTGCVTSSESEVDLDGLAPYLEDTGAGKGDDPNCTDASYREFIHAYLADTAPAADNPCAWGNDASYNIWAYVGMKELQPTFDAYSTIITKRFTSLNVTAAQIDAASTLTDAQRAKLAKLDAVKPAHAGKFGYAKWREYLYATALPLATRSVGFGGIVPDAINQHQFEITPAEDAWLTWIEAAQPTMTEHRGFAIFWDTASKVIGDNVFMPSEGHIALMKRLGATAPKSTFDEDTAAFEDAIGKRLAADVIATSHTTAALWSEALAMKPGAGGDLSYKVWASSVQQTATTLARTLTESQRANIRVLLAAKPCAGPASAALVSTLQTAWAQVPDGDGGMLGAAIVPVACGS